MERKKTVPNYKKQFVKNKMSDPFWKVPINEYREN